MTNKIQVIGTKACGSSIAEAFLVLGRIPYDLQELNYDDPKDLPKILARNPLGQVPTLILADGTILTETLAVAHFVNDLRPEARLIPAEARDRIRFFRWSTFLISSFYPTYTYGDDPKKWVDDKAGAAQLKNSTDEHRKKLWKVIEAEAGQPYFLGETFSAIDIYLKVLIHWRPGLKWNAENLPKVMAIHRTISEKAELRDLWRYHFPEP